MALPGRNSAYFNRVFQHINGYAKIFLAQIGLKSNRFLAFDFL